MTEVAVRAPADVAVRERVGDTAPRLARTGATAPPTPSRQGEQVAFAVVLHFDDATNRVVRQAWGRLDEQGVASVSTSYGPEYRPHLTLAIVDTAHPSLVADRLRPRLDDVTGVPVTLCSLGFFLTGAAPAYLAVTPTRRLLALHESVHDALGTEGSWSYYRPGSWVPHCTLAMGVDSPTAVARALAHTPLPVRATVTSAHLTRVPPAAGSPVETTALTADKQTSLLPAQHRAGPRHRRSRRIPVPFGGAGAQVS